jgi:WD40 repeat protein
LATAELDGRPIAITGGEDGKLGIRNLTRWSKINKVLTGHTGPVTAMVTGTLGGHPIVLTISKDETMRIWDLTEQRQIGQPFVGHGGAVTAVAIAELDSRSIAITGGADRSMRVWDLTTRDCLDWLWVAGVIRCLTLGRSGILIVGFDDEIAVFEPTVHFGSFGTHRHGGPFPRRRWRQWFANM